MACFCIGPQNGQPLCPCRMASVEIRDGRYVEIIDHGPFVTSIDLHPTEWRQKFEAALTDDPTTTTKGD